MKFQANGEIREEGKKVRRINSESFGRACYLCVCQWGGGEGVEGCRICCASVEAVDLKPSRLRCGCRYRTLVPSLMYILAAL